MDLLNVSELGESFDLIECNGVLHHMKNPAEGLKALSQVLKKGGFMKLGLYSKVGSKTIVDARKIIDQLGIDGSPEGIREFRELVMSGEIKELAKLAPPTGGTAESDFYTLSECRDLCFHVQEHLFTAMEIKNLLNSERLIFCGFLFPDDKAEKLYQINYPEDISMTSLDNWGCLEEANPNSPIFPRLYQFWTSK